MKIAIVDDEALARQRLQQLVKEICPDSHTIEVVNGIELLTFTMPIDVVLLDIEMPGMNGLEVAKALIKKDPVPAIIFTTAYQEHALSAFETHACGYLLKPIRKEKLQEALLAASRLNNLQIQSLQEQTQEKRTYISVYHGNVLQRIALSDILFFQAEHKYITIHTKTDRFLLEGALKSLEQEFQDIFIRIHRNALVRLDKLEALEKHADGRVYVKILGSDICLEVSRRHLAKVRKVIRGNIV